MKILHYSYYKRPTQRRMVRVTVMKPRCTKAKSGPMMSSEVTLLQGMRTSTWMKALIKARTLNLTHEEPTELVIRCSDLIFSIEE